MHELAKNDFNDDITLHLESKLKVPDMCLETKIHGTIYSESL